MISSPIIIGLYWISVAFIGFGFINLFYQLSSFSKTLSYLSKKILSLPAYIILLISFALGCVYFALLSVPLFAFGLPTILAVVAYILGLTVAAGSTGYLLWRTAFSKHRLNLGVIIKESNNLTYLVSVLLVVIICLDLVVAFLTKSNVGGDAIYHMSRVLDIVNGGFTLSSSLFSTSPEGSYHVNLIYTLYAIPADMFNLAPMKIWEYSLPFFRLLLWISIFSFSGFVWQCWLRVKNNLHILVILTTIAGYFTISPRLFVATYPNQIVIAWIVILAASIYLFLRRPKMLAATVLPTSLLITLTHPIYALMAILYVGVFGILYALRNLSKFKEYLKSYAVLLIGIAILLIGPLITYFVPSMLATGEFSLAQEKTIGHGILSIADPALVLQDSVIKYVLLTVTITASIYLLIKMWPNKRAWSAVTAMAALPVAVLYLPPLFGLLHSQLPVWVLQRFETANLIVLVAWGIVIFMTTNLAFRNKPLSGERWQKLHTLSVVVLFLVASAVTARLTYPASVTYVQPNHLMYSEHSQVANDFKATLNNNSLVIIEPSYGYMLASVLDIDVLAVEKGHFPVASDAKNRQICLNTIMQSYSKADLKAVGAKFVMVPRPSVDHPYYRAVQGKDYLQLTAANEYYLVYRVVIGNETEQNTRPAQACVDYQKNEKLLLKR